MEEDAPVASSAYVGKRSECQEGDGVAWSLEDMVGPNSKFKFSLFKWDADSTIPLVDSEERTFVLLVAPPKSSTFQHCIKAATDLLAKCRRKCRFTRKQRNHRRGDFAALSMGIVHSNGTTHPINLGHNGTNQKVLDELMAHWSIKRLVGFTTGMLKTWAPRLHNYCSDHLEWLLSSDCSLQQIFENSIFPGATFNFGPQTVSFPHVDFTNLPFGWCPIWTFGNYNHHKGGHIILWDLKMVIEFPPGSLIVIPSGSCRHSNTRIGKKETRMSFTQYFSGGLCRWVDQGFQTQEQYLNSLDQTERDRESERRCTRWLMGLGLYPTLDELGGPP
ncbi:uncharacterized protein C8R40DRAFT_1061748 [Lentinula edodes]|uniref:uncharacterized protein n=1 Tax=Lentinula edodes TaxID=5353 RepID=UPI001E8CC737|nr:uncharacterized protein C8R40DRAFT_1061748 [Lentinula edodes]KAH7868544.1 hypothetical protein C8R40DRAFT_1061748 [Lentinula edodes]